MAENNVGRKESADRVYYISLPADFQEKHAVMCIRSMAYGAESVLAYVKLLCQAAKWQGVLYFDSTLKPYTPSTLAPILGFSGTAKEQVLKTSRLLRKLRSLNLLSDLEDGGLFLPESKAMSKSVSKSSIRVMRYRSSEKNKGNADETEKDKCNKVTNQLQKSVTKLQKSYTSVTEGEKKPLDGSPDGFPFGKSVPLSVPLDEKKPAGNPASRERPSEALARLARAFASEYPKKATDSDLEFIAADFEEAGITDSDLPGLLAYVSATFQGDDFRERIAKDPSLKLIPTPKNFIERYWLPARKASSMAISPADRKAEEQRKLDEDVNDNPFHFMGDEELLRREDEGSRADDDWEDIQEELSERRASRSLPPIRDPATREAEHAKWVRENGGKPSIGGLAIKKVEDAINAPGGSK